MKTMIKVMSVSLAVLMLAMMLVACDALSGSYSATYESEGGFLGLGAGTYTTTYEFKGKNVTRTDDITVGSKTNTTTTTGTYEIQDDKIVFTWDKDVETGDNGDSSVTKTTYSFDKGDGFIYIDGKKYTKN